MSLQILITLAFGVCHPGMATSHLRAEENHNPLAALDPVHVGFVRWIDTGDGQAREVLTLAVRPPLFLIKGFLSGAESEAIINVSHRTMAEKSMMGGPNPTDTTKEVKKQHQQRSFLEFRKMFKIFDKDRNGALTSNELQRLMQFRYNLPNHDHKLFMKRYNFSSPFIWEEKLIGIDLVEYREWIMKNYPHMMERHSDQVWLGYNISQAHSVLHRAQKITGLPKAVVSGEASLQVLHYGKQGHYSCHYDSPPSHIPDGRVVRLGTMAIFLNDPEAGGQIAFPGADKEGSEKWNVTDWSNLKSECQPTNKCTTLGGVVVSPKRGDAVLWYNMKPSHWSVKADGGFTYNWKGKTDDSFDWNSLHCGAEVLKGEKWMANVWFRAIPKNRQVPSTIDAPSIVLV